MPVNSINVPRGTQQKDTLDKITQALGIAETILGVGITVPKFMQDRKKLKLEEQLIGQRAKQMEQENLLAPQKQAIETAKVKSDASKYLRPVRPGEAPDVSDPILGGDLKFREAEDVLSEREEKIFSAYSKDYQIVDPSQSKSGDIKLSFGGGDVLFRPKAEDGTKLADSASNRRKEFLSQSSGFQVQADSFAKIKSQEKASIAQKAPAQVSMLYSYIKLIDPGSVVKEGELALAEQAKGVPETILNTYNKVVSGARLSPTQVKEFVDASKGIYDSAVLQHRKRERTYRGIAKIEGLDGNLVVPDLMPDFGDQKDEETPTLEEIQAEKRKRGLR